jgi:general secretion pathway protein G
VNVASFRIGESVDASPRVRLCIRSRSIRQFSDLDPGFTMIELLVVISLIVILATMGMGMYKSSVIHSREAVLHEDLFRMRDAIDQYYADKGQYPAALDALVSEGYMRKIPVDPITNSADSWTTIPSEPDPNNPTAAPGIYDVKSGSDGTALDGSKYSDW